MVDSPLKYLKVAGDRNRSRGRIPSLPLPVCVEDFPELAAPVEPEVRDHFRRPLRAHRNELPPGAGAHLPAAMDLPLAVGEPSRILDEPAADLDLYPDRQGGKELHRELARDIHGVRLAEHRGGPPHRLIEERGNDPAVGDVLVPVEMEGEDHPSEDLVPLHEEPRAYAGAVLFPAEKTSRGVRQVF